MRGNEGLGVWMLHHGVQCAHDPPQVMRGKTVLRLLNGNQSEDRVAGPYHRSRFGIARDDPAELAEFIKRGLEFDALLVSGGSSVGVHDHVRPTLAALGVAMHFWRVEMRPGHPLAFGTTQSGGLVLACRAIRSQAWFALSSSFCRPCAD